MWFAASSLVVVLTAVIVVAQPLTPELPANSPSSHLAEPQTNAERFAAGLPPLPPTSRRSRGPHGGSRAATARRATVSPGVPVNVKCNILVKDTGGAKLGYITSKWTFGIYGALQPSKAGALEVGLSYTYNDPSSLSQLDLIASNSPNSAYPYLGGISASAGSGDIGPWNPTYQYVGGTKQSDEGPSQTVGTSMDDVYKARYKSESAIWKYNPSTQEISAQWINSDSTSPASYLIYANGLLRIAGMSDDVDTIDPMAKLVTFTCETPAAS